MSSAQRARLLFVTHRALEGSMRGAIDELEGLDSVHAVGGLVRLIGGAR